MKRILAILVAAMLCVSCAVPALAAETTFTPSVTNKPAPDIVPGEDPEGDPIIGVLYDDEGQIISYVEEPCLVVTPVSEADTSTEIPEDARQLLLDIYSKLTNGEMTLPYEKYDPDMNSSNMVIRDLFDASFLCADHPELLAEDGYTLELTFDLGVKAGVEVVAMTYVDGEWSPIVSTKNNGDGTVTCVFDAICPIAFSVEAAAEPPVQTGDVGNMSLWGLVAVIALVAIVALTVIYRIDAKKRGA